MNKLKKGLVISMAMSIILTSAAMPNVMASGIDSSGSITVAKNDKSKADEKNNTAKDDFEAKMAAIESQIKQLEKQKESLEEQYEAAKKSGDQEQAKQKKKEIKAAIRACYSSDELAKIKLAGDKIKKNNKNITILPIENIIIKGVNVKFDTPPVIKSGRTLIPVKALSEAFGAQVKWVAAEKKVIITKGTTEIVLILDSNKIYVNGVESTLDVPASSLNGRTVVPLKFIVEKLGLKVNWDKDSKDIEIEDDDTATPPAATTGSAIGTTSGSAIDTTSGSAINTTSGSAIGTTTGTAVEVTSGTSIQIHNQED